jgi:hypothetical protein
VWRARQGQVLWFVDGGSWCANACVQALSGRVDLFDYVSGWDVASI